MKKYNWKITAKKFGIIALEILVAGVLSYATDHPEFLVIVPLAEAFRNWIKHR